MGIREQMHIMTYICDTYASSWHDMSLRFLHEFALWRQPVNHDNRLFEIHRDAFSQAVGTEMTSRRLTRIMRDNMKCNLSTYTGMRLLSGVIHAWLWIGTFESTSLSTYTGMRFLRRWALR